MRTDGRHSRPHRAGRLVAGAVATAVACGAWLVHDGMATSHPPQPADAAQDAGHPATADSGSDPAADPLPLTAPADLPVSPPARIRIPALKVDAPVTELGLDAQGELESPPLSDRNLAGWYRDGAAPGANGTAVVVGHVDTRKGPAVFYGLGLLKTGRSIEVLREDGRTAVFSVDSVRVYAKRSFPTDTVYGTTGRPELRLITCGGRFDPRTGYQANTVVFAHLTAVT